MSETPTPSQQWFERIWAYREETLYRQLFGDIGPGIYTLPLGVFKQLGQADIDPRWPTHGVFECPPTATRPHWVYVTSALSNPWGQSPENVDPSGPSGLGFELLMQTPQQAKWAIQVLHWLMAVQLLVSVGKLGGELLDYFDRIPLGTAVDGQQSALRFLITSEPEGFPLGFELESGQVALLQCTGITAAEADFARTQGGPQLLTLLKHWGHFPLTDPGRKSVV